MDINDFKTDSTMEEAGVWRPLGEAQVKIVSMASERYRRAFQKASRPYEAAITLGTIKEEDQKAIMLKLYSEAVVVDWKGLTEGGKEIPYSPETCHRIFMEAPRFLDWALKEANSIENYRRAAEEKETKNS